MSSAAQQAPAFNPDQNYKISRALLSVSDKTGLAAFAKGLEKHGITLLSTGGTAKTLRDSGAEITDVSAHTGFPEIMNGRVKTLHPLIHGGILAQRNNSAHEQDMTENNIAPIDLIVANLYPFEKTVAGGGAYNDCIENIDIGGPTLIRAAAKNHQYVTVVTDPADYDEVLKALDHYDGCVPFALRQKLAAKAFAMTARYDAAIEYWFAGQLGNTQGQALRITGTHKETLRYGENPHQSAALYIDGTKRPGVTTAIQHHGKALSYNNINDTNAAFELVAEFDEPTVAIIKHANPCGVASAKDIHTAYLNALRCDSVSAFGGIIATNRALDAKTAKEIANIFSEVIIAPAIDGDALEILSQKKNLRILTTGEMPDPRAARKTVRSIAGGYLVQDEDTGHITPESLKVVTDREPTQQEMEDMIFAFRVAKHVKSNAIVYAKDSTTAGIGAGQMSRIDSSRIAARKAQDAAEKAGSEHSLAQGSVVASDAFFPFPDGLLAAADAGVTAVIQPGGSIRDEEVIAAANERGLAMAFTGMRHFKH